MSRSLIIEAKIEQLSSFQQHFESAWQDGNENLSYNIKGIHGTMQQPMKKSFDFAS